MQNSIMQFLSLFFIQYCCCIEISESSTAHEWIKKNCDCFFFVCVSTWVTVETCSEIIFFHLHEGNIRIKEKSSEVSFVFNVLLLPFLMKKKIALFRVALRYERKLGSKDVSLPKWMFFFHSKIFRLHNAPHPCASTIK